MKDAVRAETEELLQRGTFKVIIREEMPPDANVIPSLFVLPIKSTEDGQIKFKVRYVIDGPRGSQKNITVHSSQTLKPSSIRLVIALAAIQSFDVWTCDVTQAYVQSFSHHKSGVYIKDPALEFALSPDQCFKLLKPLYCLCDADDIWWETLDFHY